MRTAEIAGGGIAGLALAWALAQYGWRVRVHERSPEVREIGAGILLMNNSLSIFEHYGVVDLLLHRAVALVASERLESDGRLIQRRNLPGADRWMVLPRADLVLGLSEMARRAGAEVLTDSHVTGIDPAGALTFANGETVRADLVVAADGFRSKLRDSLGLTVLARDRDSGATRVLLNRTEAEAEPVSREYWSGRRRVGVSPCTPDWTYVYMSCPNADEHGAALPIDVADWKEAFPCLHPLLDRMPGALAVARHAYAHAVVRSWSKGHAAVIGDAAHGFPPTLGQGAGVAIANAYALARVLDKEPDVLTALRQWENRFRWVSDETQRWSLWVDTLTTQWPRQLSVVRRAVIWAIGHSKWLNRKIRVADRINVVAENF